MNSCGTGELLVIGFVLLVVLSASRMGALGNAIGKFVYSFKKASKGDGFVDGRVSRKLERTNTQSTPEDAEIVEDSRPRKN